MNVHRLIHRQGTWVVTALSMIALLLAACGGDASPSVPNLPDRVRELPGVSEAIGELPGALTELGLPDLSQVADLPQLADLPVSQAPAGGIVYNGPTEYRVAVGDFVPGTDIQLLSISDGDAEFSIAGMRSQRRPGDSLDFDGGWPGLPGTSYNLRTRIYRIGSDAIRAAGVHQLAIENITPIEGRYAPGNHTVRFPFSAGSTVGQTFSGMTFGYSGSHERGGEISGLPQGDYPYRKVGDSIQWRGQLRNDVPVEYAVRMLSYGESSARIGGVVTLSLPNN